MLRDLVSCFERSEREIGVGRTLELLATVLDETVGTTLAEALSARAVKKLGHQSNRTTTAPTNASDHIATTAPMSATSRRQEKPKNIIVGQPRFMLAISHRP
jgi:hypothetical protein